GLGGNRRRRAGGELNSEQRGGTNREVIKTAITGDLNIDERRNAGRETAGRFVRRIEQTDPAVAEIAEEIFPDVAGGKLDRGRVIESCADNCTALNRSRSVRILKQRI